MPRDEEEHISEIDEEHISEIDSFLEICMPKLCPTSEVGVWEVAHHPLMSLQTKLQWWWLKIRSYKQTTTTNTTT